MSQANVEVVRAGMEAWNARDMDALRETYAEDVVTWPPTGWAEAGPFVGRDTVMGQWERMRELWQDDEVEMRADYIDAADRVAVRMIWRDRAHGPEAGSEATGHLHHPQRENSCRGVLLGPLGSPRDSGPVGVGDVAGEAG